MITLASGSWVQDNDKSLKNEKDCANTKNVPLVANNNTIQQHDNLKTNCIGTISPEKEEKLKS